MAKILVSTQMGRDGILSIIAQGQEGIPHLLNETMVNYLTNHEDDEEENLVLEKTRMGYLVLGIYSKSGDVLYEYKESAEVEDVLFFSFLP